MLICYCCALDADRHDVVMVPNVTIGNNTVVQSVLRTLKKGDSILGFNLAYGISIPPIMLKNVWPGFHLGINLV